MRNTIPRWEHELWYYVSSGDGDSCPIYAQCQPRVGGGWSCNQYCSCQEIDCFSTQSSSQPSTNCQFIEGLQPGRIFELVEKLAQKYLKLGKIQGEPVPAALIGLIDPERSIEIRTVPLKAYHGAIWRLDDCWIIHLNSNDAPVKQRLTLFHEAFHILAHCRATPVFKKRGNNRGSFNELLAENFAYHLLMPREWVEERWETTKDPALMSDLFGVPKSAMQTRLRSLRLV